MSASFVLVQVYPLKVFKESALIPLNCKWEEMNVVSFGFSLPIHCFLEVSCLRDYPGSDLVCINPAVQVGEQKSPGVPCSEALGLECMRVVSMATSIGLT